MCIDALALDGGDNEDSDTTGGVWKLRIIINLWLFSIQKQWEEKLRVIRCCHVTHDGTPQGSINNLWHLRRAIYLFFWVLVVQLIKDHCERPKGRSNGGCHRLGQLGRQGSTTNA